MEADIAAYLATLTRGTVGTDIFIGVMGDEIDDQIVLTQTSGMPPDRTTDLEMPGLQVRVRNEDYTIGQALANTIYNDLDQLTDETINSTRYQRVEAQGSPTFLGQDAESRYLFSVNFIVYKDK